MKHILIPLLGAALLLSACGTGVEPESGLETQAQIITVTTTADEFNRDGDCSLREAIVAANTDRAVDACRGGAGHDTIVLSPRTYYLRNAHGNTPSYIRSALPFIEGDLNIEGNNAVLDGGATPDVAVLRVDVGARLFVTDLRIEDTDNRYHSAIENSGYLHGTNVALVNNHATYAPGAVENTGTLFLRFCKITGNSSDTDVGGVYTYRSSYAPADKATLWDCVIKDNESKDGAAAIHVERDSPLNVERSTVVNNRTRAGSHASRADIIRNDGELSIRNTTVSGNSGRTFDVIDNQGELTVEHSTLYDNSSYHYGDAVALKNGGDASLSHTVLGEHTRNCQGSVTSLGYNLADDGTCNLSGAGDREGLNPGLRPLADNGGDTLTHALSYTSPLRNAGDPSYRAADETDQRGEGFPRRKGARVDIGAYEGCGNVLELGWHTFPDRYSPRYLCLDDLLRPRPVDIFVIPRHGVAFPVKQKPDLPCERCSATVELGEPGVISLELSERAFEKVNIEALVLFNAKGEAVAKSDGTRLKAKLEAGTYTLELVGEVKEPTAVPVEVSASF